MEEVYEELVIKVPYPHVRGFITGLLWARGGEEKVYYNREEHIRTEGLGGLVKEWLARRVHPCHIIARKETADALVKGVEDTREKLGLEIRSRRVVASARFCFSYHAYAKKYGESIKVLFAELEEGLVLSDDYAPEETLHPEAGGVEGYAPEHAYEIRAKGTVTGPLIPLLRLHKSARKQALIDVEDIELELE